MSNNWPKVKLGDVLEHRKEFVTVDDLKNYRRPRVQLHAQGIVLRDELPGALIKTKEQQICRAGEFLVAEIDAKVGGYGIVPELLDGCIVSSHYFLFVVNPARLDRNFLDYFIRTPTFGDQVAAQGSTNYAAIRPSHVLNYEIPLPPLAEQRRIVARIEKLSAEIKNARKLRSESVNEVDGLWKSGLFHAFRPTLNLSGVVRESPGKSVLQQQSAKYSSTEKVSSNGATPSKPRFYAAGPYELPAGWVWTDLGSILTHLVDCVNDTPDFSPVPTDFIGLKSTNIRPYKLDLSRVWYVTSDDFARWNRRQQPQEGDLVLTREAPMGNVCILPSGKQICLTQRLMLLRSDLSFVDPRYVLHFLNSFQFVDQVSEQCRGLTTPHIRVQDAPFFKVPFAPPSEQRRIVAYLDDLQQKTDSLRVSQAETSAELDALMPSILDKAFRGEL
jgi:type I restriction enzyme S subunit